MDFTEQEQKVLSYMFRTFSDMLEFVDDGIRIGDEWFSKNELFALAEKLNIDY